MLFTFISNEPVWPSAFVHGIALSYSDAIAHPSGRVINGCSGELDALVGPELFYGAPVCPVTDVSQIVQGNDEPNF
jgi:hypothetical protein